jgi:hypothetical protein
MLRKEYPGVLSMFLPITNQPWMQLIPVLGQYALGAAVLSGGAPSPQMLIATALEALALSGLLLFKTARLFQSERFIFGRS